MDPQPPLTAVLLSLSAWLAGLAVVFVPLERLFAARPREVFRAGLWTDLGYYFLNSLLPAVLLAPPMAAVAWAVARVMPPGVLETTAAWPLWARLAVGLVVGEVGYYWGHRLCHEVPFLWRFHAVHHSAEHVDFLVNTRAHPVDMVFGRLCALAPMFALGLGTPLAGTGGLLSGGLVPVLVTLAGTAWGFFVHANLRWRLGPVEWLVATPAFHHWHHTRSGPLNKNYASTLPALDRLFGTHHLPAAFPADYGISGEMPAALVDQLVHPLFPPRPLSALSPDTRSTG